jgi:hypothetical protein
MELKLQHAVLLSYVKFLRLSRDRRTTKSHKKKLDHGSAESLETLSYKKLLLLLLLCQLCLKLGFFCFFL